MYLVFQGFKLYENSSHFVKIEINSSMICSITTEAPSFGERFCSIFIKSLDSVLKIRASSFEIALDLEKKIKESMEGKRIVYTFGLDSEEFVLIQEDFVLGRKIPTALCDKVVDFYKKHNLKEGWSYE